MELLSFQDPPEGLTTPETQAVHGVVQHLGELIVLLDLERTLNLVPEPGSKIA